MSAIKILILVVGLAAMHTMPKSWADEAPLSTPSAPDPSSDTTVYPEVIPSKADPLVDRPDYDASTPYFMNAKSHFAFGLRASIQGFPTSDAIGNTYQLYGQYMIQAIGAGYFFSGLYAGLLPLNVAASTIPYPNLGNAVGGAEIGYQIKYARDAWVVPFFAGVAEYYDVRATLADNTMFSGFNFGLSLGLMLNLNVFDSVTTKDAYMDLGMTRGYLTFERRGAAFSAPSGQITGNYWLMGLRLEFE